MSVVLLLHVVGLLLVNIVSRVKCDDQLLGEVATLVPCSGVCREGKSVGLPNNTLVLPGVPGDFSCQQIDLLLPALYPNSSHPDCQAIQSVGVLCGCATPSNACMICGDKPMVYPERPLEFFFLDLVGGIIPDCSLLDAFLRTSNTQDDAACTESQGFLAEYCCGFGDDGGAAPTNPPCTLCADGSPITLPDAEIIMEGFPFTNCKQLDQAAFTLFETGSEMCTLFQAVSSICGCPRKANSCNYCPDGGQIVYPDKPVRFLKQAFGGMVPSCQVLEAYTHSLDSGDVNCPLIQTSSGLCGCAPIENHCEICPREVGRGLKPEYEEVEIDPLLLSLAGIGEIPFAVTCELVFGMESQLPNDSKLCLYARLRNDICGCNNGEYVMLGARTTAEKQLLVILATISGAISLIGALAILLDVVCNRKKRQQMYCQLMASMSLIDAITSIAFMTPTYANPTNDSWPVYGERGNDATCTFQGFIIQLRLLSAFYNISLCAFYYMAIVLGWKETKLKSKAKYLHALPIVFGLALCFAGIPYYGSVLMYCHIPVPPLSASMAPKRWLYSVPVFTAITICPILMFLVWLKVHRQAAASSRWNFSAFSFTPEKKNGTSSTKQGEDSSSLSILLRESSKEMHLRFAQRLPSKSPSLTTLDRVKRSVMWQGIYYVVVFCFISVTTLALERQCARGVSIPYSTYCFSYFINPLQPFLNALNYFRPRVGRFLRRWYQQLWIEIPKLSQSQGIEMPPDGPVGATFPPVVAQSERARARMSRRFSLKQTLNVNFSTHSDVDSIVEPSAFLETKEPVDMILAMETSGTQGNDLTTSRVEEETKCEVEETASLSGKESKY